jgi:threonine/homoserine/homoserine lactone efflux protein
MLAAIIKGLALGFLLSISVGPVIFSIIKKSLRDGHKAAYLFVAGVSISDCTFVLIANLFTSVFERALAHKSLIAILGSIFLIGMGIYTIFFKKTAVADFSGDEVDKVFSRRDMLANFISGYLMNLLNPGAFIFWFAWSAAILTASVQTAHPAQYRVLVFGTCLLFVLLSDLLKVLLAGKLRNKLTPRNMHNLDRLNGIILMLFGSALLLMYIKY